MIEKNTVIITGAGANNDYGFPTGNELKIDIPNKLINWYKALYHPPDTFFDLAWNEKEDGGHRVYFNKYLNFLNAFKIADIPIDQYISQQNLSKEFEKIAKHAIILGMIEYEYRSNLTGHWLEELFSQMTRDLHNTNGYTQISKNRVTIITFNYDRAIEQFFYNKVKNSYGISDVKTKNVVNNIDIIHVYGSIANLIWQNDPVLEYGANNSRPVGHYTIELSENIDLIREDRDVSELKSYTKIKDVLNSAERLYILGFGYYDYNIKILGFPETIKTVEEVYSTKKNLIGRRFERSLYRIFKYQQNQPIDQPDRININDITCEQLIRKYDLE